MSLKLSFSWIGIVVFALPMLINIIYAIFPPVGDAVSSKKVMRPAEIIENVSRAAYLVLLTVLAIPRAVFPVLYFLCAAVWLGNLPAAISAVIFGAAHITVSVQSFR